MASNGTADADNETSDVSTNLALSYDHILEQIFDALEPEDLLHCRLVCSRWLLFAQKPLQKQLRLSFCKNKPEGQNQIDTNKSFTKYLTELTNLLKNGQSLSESQDNNGTKNNFILFPCKQFTFKRGSLSDDDLQQFLNTNGQNIRELLLLQYSEDTPNILMDNIANLLLIQAPNIENIFLMITKGRNQGPQQIENIIECPLKPTDSEYKELCQKAQDFLDKSKTLPNSGFGSSLKVLDLFFLLCKGLPKLLEFIIRLSPNLEEIILEREHYKYYLAPENRLHLLKSLTFELDLTDNSSIEEMDRISRGNLNLKKIKINLKRDQKWRKRIRKNPQFEPRIVEMINRIFEGSCNTIEEIEFDKVTSLRGIKLPEVMPKVRELKLASYSNEVKVNEAKGNEAHVNGHGHASSNFCFFPMGFNMEATFPKLHSIHFANHTEVEDSAIFSNLLKFFHFGADRRNSSLSKSVRRVIFFSLFINSDGEEEPLPGSISTKIQRWFPNARIEGHE